MKRKTFFLLSLFFCVVIFTFTSCSASIEPSNSNDDYAYVVFSEDALRSLVIEYEIKSYGSLFWDYTAEKKDGYGQTGAVVKAPVSKDSNDKQIVGLNGKVGPLSQGKWQFTIYAYESIDGLKSENLVYQGTSDIVILKGGETKSVPVSVMLQGDFGTLDFSNAKFAWNDGGKGDVYIKTNIIGSSDNSASLEKTVITQVVSSNDYKMVSPLDFGYGVGKFPAGYYTCTVQAYVKEDLNSTQTEVISDSTYKASQTFGLRVYGNTTTIINGDIKEGIFASVSFDVLNQDMKVFVPLNDGSAKVDGISVTPQKEGGKTSVEFSAGSLTNIEEGSALQLDVKVTPLESSNQKFNISGTTEDSKSAFAGIDITLWKTDSSGSTQLKDFNSGTVTITTFIAKKLSNVSVHYNKVDGDAENIKTEYIIETVNNEIGEVSISTGYDGVYYADTGKLVFNTTHFSEYYVLADCEAIINSKNVGYSSLQKAIDAAVSMSSSEDNTIKLTKDITLTSDLKLGSGQRDVNLNLNGKTINGNSWQVYTAGNGTINISGDGTITNTNEGQSADYAPLRIYEGSNVVLDGLTVIGKYCGVKNSGNLTINKATIKGNTFGLGCFGSGKTEIGIAGGNNEDVSISANEQALATAAATGSSDMFVNVYCGSFETKGTVWDDCPIYWAGHGTLNIYGGSFSNTTSGSEAAGLYQKNGIVNIFDGVFTARAGIKVGAEATDSKSINLNVYGGRIVGTNHAALYYKTTSNGNNCTEYSISIFGGEFTGIAAKGSIFGSVSGGVITPSVFVTGGTFTTDPSEYVPFGYDVTSSVDGKYVVSESSSLVINDVDQLVKFASSVNNGIDFAGKTITLGSNINLEGKTWVSIGKDSTSPFKGIFDGQGNTIEKLTYKGNSDYAGFIGYLDGGEVKNTVFMNPNIQNTSSDTGVAVGRIVNGGRVSEVTVSSGSVTGCKRTGGIVGSIIADGKIISCQNSATVSSTVYNAGGIVGAAYYTKTGKSMSIERCTNSGTVTSSGNCAGGIVGLSAADVTGCSNNAEITGSGTGIGGIVGEQKTFGSVTNNTNTGDVKNTNSSSYGNGGIIGWLRYHGDSEASSYKESAIIAVTDNNNSGSVSGGNDAGGIVGTVYNSAIVKNNINEATTLSGTTFAAGVVGNYQTTEKPAAYEPAKNRLIFIGNTSSTGIDKIAAINKDELIYTNRNQIITVEQ